MKSLFIFTFLFSLSLSSLAEPQKHSFPIVIETNGLIFQTSSNVFALIDTVAQKLPMNRMSGMAGLLRADTASIEQLFLNFIVVQAYINDSGAELLLKNKDGEKVVHFETFSEMEAALQGTPWAIERLGKDIIFVLKLQKRQGDFEKKKKLRSKISAVKRKQKGLSTLEEMYTLNSKGEISIYLGFGIYSDHQMDFAQNIRSSEEWVLAKINLNNEPTSCETTLSKGRNL